jgi:peptidylprolyl isomerase
VPAARRAIPLIAAVAVMLAAGCSADPDAGAADATGSAATTDLGVGTDTTAAPTITVPDEDPPEDLVVDVVVEGEGEPVEAGDLLVADYLGVLWDTGETFDASWDRGEPAAFAIGVDQVIDGWDTGLVGQPVGSRVVLVIPPDQGYGDDGSGSIPPDSTLVFAVDIRDSFNADDVAGATPVTDLPADLPEVSGEPGQQPTITIGDSPTPQTSSSIVVAEGTGDPVDTSGQIVVQAQGASFTSGETVYSTWDASPEPVPAAGLPGLAEALEGAGAGTRVLVLLSAADSGGEPLALVLDVLGSV